MELPKHRRVLEDLEPSRPFLVYQACLQPTIAGGSLQTMCQFGSILHLGHRPLILSLSAIGFHFVLGIPSNDDASPRNLHPTQNRQSPSNIKQRIKQRIILAILLHNRAAHRGVHLLHNVHRLYSQHRYHQSAFIYPP